ncbi:MAG: ATP-binding cassette domain-containing protein [Elusimicrobia bacterium]|nr:ATP-binding cassette domain-containing protein [Elusimicrobiota bacterium]
MRPILQASGVTKRFTESRGLMQVLRRPWESGAGILAVDDVSLELGEGEVFALLGPNGAGKSTLIKMLCSLIIPDSGTILIDGHDAAADACRTKPLIGLMTPEESRNWRNSSGSRTSTAGSRNARPGRGRSWPLRAVFSTSLACSSWTSPRAASTRAARRG